MPAILRREGDQLELDLSPLSGSSFQDALAKVREIPGRRFDYDRKLWVAPAEVAVADRIVHSIEPEVDDELREWISAARVREAAELTTPLPDDAELLIPWANKRAPWQPEYLHIADEKVLFSGLMQHQRPAVDVAATRRKLIIADDMGLGKTSTMISALAEGLLRCSNEQHNIGGKLPSVASKKSRASQTARAGIDRTGEETRPGTVLAEGQGSNEEIQEQPYDVDSQRQEQPVRGLRDTATGGSDGVGSRSRHKTIHAGTGKQTVRTGRVCVDEGGCARGDSEVRRALPELSPHEALRQGPKLVVCPTSVQGTWEGQIRMWLGSDEPLVIVNGSTAKKRQEQLEQGIEDNAWVIVNWEQLRVTKVTRTIKRRNGSSSKKTEEAMKQPLFEKTPWLAVFADECHRAKNRKAQVTRGLWRVQAPYMYAASGTPIMNNPAEIWALLHWLYPKEYTSYWRFYEAYVEYTEGHWGKTITGVKNPDALRFELRERLIRRTQGEVLDLPGKVRIPVPFPLNPKQRKLYDKAVSEMWLEIEAAVKEGDKSAAEFVAAAADGASFSKLLRLPNGAARTVRLRQIMESPALLGGEDDSAVLDTAVDLIMDSRPEPWVVFTEFADTPGLLVERLRKQGVTAVEYTGRVDPKERSEIERQFQAGEIDVIAGTLKSLYQGITLTAGNRQFWCSRDWVPAVNEQGEARQDRISQTDRVLVYIAQPQDTVATSKIEPLNRLKESIVASVIKTDPVEQEKHGSL